MELQHVVAVVTGGASGLGEGTTRRLIAGGAKVVLADLNEEKGQALARELGEHAVFCKTNVTSEDEIQAAVDVVVTRFGKLNVLVNCAGVGDAMRTVHVEKGPHPLDRFKRVIEINLIGTFNAIRLASFAM